MVITSLDNNKIKDLIKLSMKKYRDLTNTFIVETPHLVEEAYKSGIVKEIYLIEGETVDYDIPVTYVSNEVMKKITTMDNPSTMIALCEKKNSNEIIGNKILLLDNIQDPGNLGTIIRSSVAFNVDTIVLSLETVDLYNPKVLRSTQGMFCHVNIITMNVIDAINEIKKRGIKVYGTNVNSGNDVRDIDNTSSYALVMGNEGNGVKQEILDMCDSNLYIKMNKKAESLNVGVACSILLYELER
ncbi:MAG: RNA methyltransferase [Bacilli bacterium]|nr:RNA methyltransferase [Bacilli bacterium]